MCIRDSIYSSHGAELRSIRKLLHEKIYNQIKNLLGQKNKIEISNQEIQNEIQKQLKMMPGQEKMVKDYYEKNPSALDTKL